MDAGQLGELLERYRAEQALYRRPSHPQLIDGTLYVSPPQYDALLELAKQSPFSEPAGLASGAIDSLTGIPVVIVKAAEPVRLADGRSIVYSTITNALYIVDAKVGL